ncbi:hypothetical protein ACS0TY_032021 [Phlomoides rotata]
MARATDSSSNQDANADEDETRITGKKRNEEGTTTSNSEQLPTRKKARASNSSSNQDVNAGNAHTSRQKRNDEGKTEQLLVQLGRGCWCEFKRRRHSDYRADEKRDQIEC